MHRFFYSLSRVMAVLGGVMLSLLILLTCLSVLGRGLNDVLHSDGMQAVAPNLAAWLLNLGIGPVNGDYELVESGVAFAIFAFLPLCQLSGGHAAVEIFTARWSIGVNRWRQALTDGVFAVVLIVIAVQLAAGTFSKFNSGQTTLLIQFPLWWAYALSLIGAGAAAIIGVYVASVRIAELMQGHAILTETPKDMG